MQKESSMESLLMTALSVKITVNTDLIFFCCIISISLMTSHLCVEVSA